MDVLLKNRIQFKFKLSYLVYKSEFVLFSNYFKSHKIRETSFYSLTKLKIVANRLFRCLLKQLFAHANPTVARSRGDPANHINN